MMDEWEAAKQRGSDHYRAGTVQPVDLYRSAGVMRQFGLCNVIKYAYRCLVRGISASDLDKICHYVDLVRADYNASCLHGAEPSAANGDNRAQAHPLLRWFSEWAEDRR